MWKGCSLKFCNMHRKAPVLESLFNEVARPKASNFIKKGLKHRFCPVNFAEFLRTPILKNICDRLLLYSRLIFCPCFLVCEWQSDKKKATVEIRNRCLILNVFYVIIVSITATNRKTEFARSFQKFQVIFIKAHISLTQAKPLLRIVSATFLLVCFVCLKESTCETRKNVFFFTSKALFVLEIIKF